MGGGSSRLHKRVLEIVCQRLPGSTITFLNGVDYDKFTELMTENGLRRTSNNANTEYRVYELHPPYEGIFLRHIQGDSALPHVLEPVINGSTIHTAIVLGTQANVRLRGRSRDTRVLNIMLLLRKLWNVKQEGVPMHIVGENNEDMTAKLALAPQRFKQKAQSHDKLARHILNTTQISSTAKPYMHEHWCKLLRIPASGLL